MNSEKQIQTENIHKKLADFTETLDREKIEVTSEVERYIEENVRMVNEKLESGESVYPSDLEFIKKINLWVECEGKYTLEQLDSEQFKALLKLAQEADKDISWIKDTFVIEGSKIVCRILNLMDCKGLRELPEGLTIEQNLWLKSCTGLRELPEGLTVGGYVNLNRCTKLKKLPESLTKVLELELIGCSGLRELPEGLTVFTDLKMFHLKGIRELPEGLTVGKNLQLHGCTGLTRLPKELAVGGILYLSDNLNEQVKADAKKLYKAGKIKEIKYV